MKCKCCKFEKKGCPVDALEKKDKEIEYYRGLIIGWYSAKSNLETKEEALIKSLCYYDGQ